MAIQQGSTEILDKVTILNEGSTGLCHQLPHDDKISVELKTDKITNGE